MDSPEEVNQAELVRLKYKYRELILKKRIKLPHKKASKLIGPDCAYHLYSGFSGKSESKSSK